MMIRFDFLNSSLHQQLNRLVWAWLLAVPVLIAVAVLSGSLPLSFRFPGAARPALTPGGGGGEMVAVRTYESTREYRELYRPKDGVRYARENPRRSDAGLLSVSADPGG